MRGPPLSQAPGSVRRCKIEDATRVGKRRINIKKIGGCVEHLWGQKSGTVRQGDANMKPVPGKQPIAAVDGQVVENR